MCPSGKAAFLNRALAKQYKKLLKRQDEKQGIHWPVDVYLCQSCGYYHIGHRPMKGRYAV